MQTFIRPSRWAEHGTRNPSCPCHQFHRAIIYLDSWEFTKQMAAPLRPSQAAAQINSASQSTIDDHTAYTLNTYMYRLFLCLKTGVHFIHVLHP